MLFAKPHLGGYVKVRAIVRPARADGAFLATIGLPGHTQGKGMNLRPPTTVGIALTVLYLFVWGLVLLMIWPGAKNMGLNEWGDFFAGGMAPLALLWLVLGYFQQSEELRQNTLLPSRAARSKP